MATSRTGGGQERWQDISQLRRYCHEQGRGRHRWSSTRCGGSALDAVSEAGSAGIPPPAGRELPDDGTLQPITQAVRALLGVLASGKRLGSVP